MSDYNTREGKLKRVNLENETILDAMKRILTENNEFKSTESVESDFMDLYWEKYIKSKTNLYEIIEHKKLEHEDMFCKLTKNPDGTISYYTTYYNGGTCESEMVEDELDREGL